jgi:hypothetical protein
MNDQDPESTPPPGLQPPPDPRPLPGQQPAYFQQRPYGQHPPGWGSAQPPPFYGYPPVPGYLYAPPKHPSAMTAMVLGIVGVAGGLMCFLPLFVAPFAWFYGHRVITEVDASNGTLGGRSEAKAGLILGIVGTVLLILALAFTVLWIVLTLTMAGF